MSLAVVAGYTLAWLPFNLLVLVGPDRIVWYPHYVFFACHSLAMAHTTYNPVIYAWMNVRFRTAFLSVLSRLNILCPCLLNLCLARNSSPINTNSQYPFNSYYNSNHHSLYIRQQIYGSSGHGSNKELQQQHPNNKQLQDPNNKNAVLSAAAKHRATAAYQLTNGSIKSTLDSDPLVLISIPTDQIDNHHKNKQLLASQQNQVINANIITTIPQPAVPTVINGGIIKETNLNNHNQLSSCTNETTTKLNNNASAKINCNNATNTTAEGYQQIATTVITCNNKNNNSHSSPSHLTVTGDKLTGNGNTTPNPSPPVPIEILTTAKAEDLIDENEDSCDEVEAPVWT